MLRESITTAPQHLTKALGQQSSGEGQVFGNHSLLPPPSWEPKHSHPLPAPCPQEPPPQLQPSLALSAQNAEQALLGELVNHTQLSPMCSPPPGNCSSTSLQTCAFEENSQEAEGVVRRAHLELSDLVDGLPRWLSG